QRVVVLFAVAVAHDDLGANTDGAVARSFLHPGVSNGHFELGNTTLKHGQILLSLEELKVVTWITRSFACGLESRGKARAIDAPKPLEVFFESLEAPLGYCALRISCHSQSPTSICTSR